MFLFHLKSELQEIHLATSDIGQVGVGVWVGGGDRDLCLKTKLARTNP